MNRLQRNRYRLSARNKSGACRLSVFRSNAHVYAQVFDVNGNVLAASSSVSKKCEVYASCKMEKGLWVGQQIAKKIAGKVQVYFDRGSYRYHGVVRQVAEGARKGGLEF